MKFLEVREISRKFNSHHILYPEAGLLNWIMFSVWSSGRKLNCSSICWSTRRLRVKSWSTLAQSVSSSPTTSSRKWNWLNMRHDLIIMSVASVGRSFGHMEFLLITRDMSMDKTFLGIIIARSRRRIVIGSKSERVLSPWMNFKVCPLEISLSFSY